MRPFSALLAVALTFAAVAAHAQLDREIVQVNGTPIRQSELFDRLWKLYGPATLDDMVDELLLRQAVEGSGIKVPQAEVERRFDKVKEQFQDPKLLEAELANAGTNADKLKLELRDGLAREKLLAQAEKLAVSDAELKKAFDEHKEELGQREAVHLRHILVATQKDADDVVAAVKGGADFQQLARDKSLAPTGKINGGDYGFVSKGMLPPDIEQVAFSLQPKELKVIPSDKGFHVLQALERRPAKPAQFAKVKDDLREMMLQEKIKAALPDYVKQLRAKADIKMAAPAQ